VVDCRLYTQTLLEYATTLQPLRVVLIHYTTLVCACSVMDSLRKRLERSPANTIVGCGYLRAVLALVSPTIVTSDLRSAIRDLEGDT
jgi:hypothetical protein